MLLFLVGGVAAFVAVMLRPVIRMRLSEQAREAAAAVDESLNAGDFAAAVTQAQTAVEKARRSGKLLGESLMLLGTVHERKAETAKPGERVVCLTAASQHYQDAEKAGVPAELRPQLTLRIARCFYARHQIPECLPLLEQLLTRYPEGRAEVLRLIALANLNSGHLDLDRAMQATSELLGTAGADIAVVAEAWARRAEILKQLGKPDTLADIDVAATRTDLRWAGPIVAAVEAHENKSYDAAITGYTKIVAMKNLPQAVERRCWYLMGIAARDNGGDEAAISAFRTVEWRYPNTDESRAAAAQAGAILLRQDKTSQAIAVLNRAANHQLGETDTSDVLLGKTSVNRLIATAIERLRDQGRFEAAAELIETYRRIEDVSTAERAAAALYEAWAGAKLEEAESLAPADAEQAKYRAAELYRAAGTFILRMADASESPEPAAPHLWRAAQNFARGAGHVLAVGALDRFLATGETGNARAAALALMCEVLDGCGRPDQVAQTAELCAREFPRHPATHKALFHLARCQIAAEEIEAAEANLAQILRYATSETDPIVLQKSRLYLAHLFSERDQHEDAIPRLKELLANPADPEVAIEARLLLSECLRVRARRPADRIQDAQSKDARSYFRQRREGELDEALELLSTTERELARLGQRGQLTAIQSDRLRQSRWGIAECLYEAERYDDAISIYQAFAETYPELKDWLESQVQLANCHFRLGHADEARQVLRAAKTRLDETPQDAVEQARVGMSAARWKEWIDWLRQL